MYLKTFFQIVLSNMILNQIHLTQLKVDLGAMALNRCSTFPRDPELQPHHQMQFSVIFKTAPFGVRRSYLSAGDTISVFKTPSAGWFGCLRQSGSELKTNLKHSINQQEIIIIEINVFPFVISVICFCFVIFKEIHQF